MSDRHKHLEFLRKTAKDALWKGDYDRALTLYEDGLALARSWKDRELEDLFTCNRATTLLEIDRFDFDLGRLKEIFLRSPRSYNGVLAAYVSSHAHEKRGEYERAVFYARTALQRSQEEGFEELDRRIAELAGQPRAPREPLRIGAGPLPAGAGSPGGRGRGRHAPRQPLRGQPRLLPHRSRSGRRRDGARAPRLWTASSGWARAGPRLSVPGSLLRVPQARTARRRPRRAASARSRWARSSTATTSSRTRTTFWPRRTRSSVRNPTPTVTTTRWRTTTRTSRRSRTTSTRSASWA